MITCPECRASLPADALACPSCQWLVNGERVQALAAEATHLAKEGRALHVRLCVDKTKPRDEAGLLPWQKRGRDFPGRRGRRLPYVTWEGHREFMRIVFRDHPEARIKSAIADYRGRDDFWVKHPETKGRWNGPGY